MSENLIGLEASLINSHDELRDMMGDTHELEVQLADTSHKLDSTQSRLEECEHELQQAQEWSKQLQAVNNGASKNRKISEHVQGARLTTYSSQILEDDQLDHDTRIRQMQQQHQAEVCTLAMLHVNLLCR